MKNKLKKLAFYLLFTGSLVVTSELFAQAPPPPPDPEDPQPAVPIDGGIGLLAAAGIGYGIKKYRDSRKRT